MKLRLVTMILISVMLVAAAEVRDTLTHTGNSTTAFACSGWSIEHYNTASVAFWSPQFGAYDTLYARVITRDASSIGSQCGQTKQYQSIQWTALGTTGNYFTEVRAWTCGGYDGAWSSATASTYSPELFYPSGCTRQADNNGSWFHVAASGAYVGVYVNQG